MLKRNKYQCKCCCVDTVTYSTGIEPHSMWGDNTMCEYFLGVVTRIKELYYRMTEESLQWWNYWQRRFDNYLMTFHIHYSCFHDHLWSWLYIWKLVIRKWFSVNMNHTDSPAWMLIFLAEACHMIGQDLKLSYVGSILKKLVCENFFWICDQSAGNFFCVEMRDQPESGRFVNRDQNCSGGQSHLGRVAVTGFVHQNDRMCKLYCNRCYGAPFVHKM